MIKTKWYQFRKKFSDLLIQIAIKVYPCNPELQAFWEKVLMESLVSGNAITLLKLDEFITPTAPDPNPRAGKVDDKPESGSGG